jgi:hypothetical protein
VRRPRYSTKPLSRQRRVKVGAGLLHSNSKDFLAEAREDKLDA